MRLDYVSSRYMIFSSLFVLAIHTCVCVCVCCVQVMLEQINEYNFVRLALFSDDIRCTFFFFFFQCQYSIFKIKGVSVVLTD